MGDPHSIPSLLHIPSSLKQYIFSMLPISSHLLSVWSGLGPGLATHRSSVTLHQAQQADAAIRSRTGRENIDVTKQTAQRWTSYLSVDACRSKDDKNSVFQLEMWIMHRTCASTFSLPLQKPTCAFVLCSICAVLSVCRDVKPLATGGRGAASSLKHQEWLISAIAGRFTPVKGSTRKSLICSELQAGLYDHRISLYILSRELLFTIEMWHLVSLDEQFACKPTAKPP